MPGTKISAQKHRSVLIPLKILFWRLCDYRRPYRGALSPISSPVARAAFIEAVLLQMPRLAAGTHFLATRTDDTMPLADSLNITNTHTPRNPRGTQFVTFFLQRLSHSPDTRTDALRTSINTDDLHHVISRDFNTERLARLHRTLKPSAGSFRYDRVAIRSTCFPQGLHTLRQCRLRLAGLGSIRGWAQTGLSLAIFGRMSIPGIDSSVTSGPQSSVLPQSGNVPGWRTSEQTAVFPAELRCA